LVLWASLASAQRPSDPDAQAAIERTRQKALAYARSLPDFVCTEIVRRSSDPSQRGRWVQTDKLTIRLSYFQQLEDHKLMQIDDKPTERSYASLEGATGVGEFGGTLRSIFDPASQAVFRWEGWKNVRKHRAAVYSYLVLREHSHYIIATGVRGGDVQQGIVGYHGQIEIDRETDEVLHFAYEADHIPKPLRVDYALTTVDYDLADVGGHQYLLPARSDTEMRSPRLTVRNQMEFREYRKFSTESTISFGDQK
jgi:hypothetical protein